MHKLYHFETQQLVNYIPFEEGVYRSDCVGRSEAIFLFLVLWPFYLLIYGVGQVAV